MVVASSSSSGCFSVASKDDTCSGTGWYVYADATFVFLKSVSLGARPIAWKRSHFPWVLQPEFAHPGEGS